MRHVTFIAFLLLFSVCLVSPVWAQDPIVYPAKGQSEDQMEKDKYQCYSWAKNQTGFDPMKTPTTTSAPPAKEKEVWRGCAEFESAEPRSTEAQGLGAERDK
jgi:hypothetical protein